MGQIVSDVTDLLEYKDNKSGAKSQRKEILSQMAADEKDKTNLIKKALSAQRAKFGASGMSTSGISEGAVLKRLQSETAAPFEEKRKSNLKKLKTTKAAKPNLLKTLLSRIDELV